MSAKNCRPPLSSGRAAPGSRRDVFQAVADPIRRRLLESLAESPDGMSVAAMTKRLPISRTAVNKHLAVLKGAGLVQHQRVGREARYQLAPEPLDRLREWLTFFDGYWNQHLSALAQYVEKDDDAT